jgi:hypothetical protein
MYKRIGILLVTFLLATAVFSSIVWAETAVPTDDTALYLPLVTAPVLPPQVITFTANVPIADPGETITLSWETRNAVSTTLYHLIGGVFGLYWDVPPTGSMTYTINSGTRNYETFALFATAADHTFDAATLTLPLTCPFTWFFGPAPDTCPQYGALVSPAAEQRFEGGIMIWVGEEDYIYVLFDDTQWTDGWAVFTDEWEEGDPIDDPSLVPPSGFYQPQRGFGLVWREQPNIRDRLGWALAPESGGETAVQRTSYYKYNHTYLKALDNTVWHLLPERSDWEKLVPDWIN